MATYKVRAFEKVWREYEVEAESQMEAIETVEDGELYDDGVEIDSSAPYVSEVTKPGQMGWDDAEDVRAAHESEPEPETPEGVKHAPEEAKSRVWYWVREYSESSEFPDVAIYRTEQEARESMIAAALAIQKSYGDSSWVTEDMDGHAITICLINQWGNFHERVECLNVQRHGGGVDCLRLESQEV